jgi:hypothetical protein
MDVSNFASTYRTPLWLAGIFVVLLGVFAITPDPISATSADAEPTSEPTPGPHECVVCPIDQHCDGKSSQCVFLDHTPLPCVKSAKYDDKAKFCLPEGAPAPPAVSDTGAGRTGPEFPGGIGGDRARQPRLPGFGNTQRRGN